MDIILLTAILIGFVANIFFTKFFSKKLLEKLLESFEKDREEVPEKTFVGLNPASAIRPTAARNPLAPQYDKPAKNTVLDVDENDIELNENQPIVVPPDVKFEVEGGDSFIPPGFSEKVH